MDNATKNMDKTVLILQIDNFSLVKSSIKQKSSVISSALLKKHL